MSDPRKTQVVLNGVVAAVSVTPLCGLWFSCGCDWPWGDFFTACDAILKNTPPPHCPWCVHPLTALISIALSLAAGTLAVRKVPALQSNACAEFLYGTGIGAAVFTGVLLLSGWLSALVTAHPAFLGVSLDL
jgi:hypothetical protein